MWRSRTVLTLCAMCVAVLAASACSDPETAKRQYLESGKKYAAEGKYQEAVVQYRNALKRDPLFGEARWKLAEAYVGAQNPQRAMVEYIRAADLLPQNTDVQLKAGTYLLLARRFDDAK